MRALSAVVLLAFLAAGVEGGAPPSPAYNATHIEGRIVTDDPLLIYLDGQFLSIQNAHVVLGVPARYMFVSVSADVPPPAPSAVPCWLSTAAAQRTQLPAADAIWAYFDRDDRYALYMNCSIGDALRPAWAQHNPQPDEFTAGAPANSLTIMPAAWDGSLAPIGLAATGGLAGPYRGRRVTWALALSARGVVVMGGYALDRNLLANISYWPRTLTYTKQVATQLPLITGDGSAGANGTSVEILNGTGGTTVVYALPGGIELDPASALIFIPQALYDTYFAGPAATALNVFTSTDGTRWPTLTFHLPTRTAPQSVADYGAWGFDTTPTAAGAPVEPSAAAAPGPSSLPITAAYDHYIVTDAGVGAPGTNLFAWLIAAATTSTSMYHCMVVPWNRTDSARIGLTLLAYALHLDPGPNAAPNGTLLLQPALTLVSFGTAVFNLIGLLFVVGSLGIWAIATNVSLTGDGYRLRQAEARAGGRAAHIGLRLVTTTEATAHPIVLALFLVNVLWMDAPRRFAFLAAPSPDGVPDLYGWGLAAVLGIGISEVLLLLVHFFAVRAETHVPPLDGTEPRLELVRTWALQSGLLSALWFAALTVQPSLMRGFALIFGLLLVARACTVTMQGFLWYSTVLPPAGRAARRVWGAFLVLALPHFAAVLLFAWFYAFWPAMHALFTPHPYETLLAATAEALTVLLGLFFVAAGFPAQGAAQA